MMILNTKKFEHSLITLMAENQKAVEQALFDVGVAIINQSEPMVPIKEGNLVGSFSISIGSKTKLAEAALKGDAPAPLPPDKSGARPNELRVSYNMPYAYRLHEKPFNPGKKSQRKGNVTYKWMTRAIAKMNIPSLFSRRYKLRSVIT